MNKSTTPQSIGDKKSTNEKKMVQARLPFKVLSTSTEISTPSLEFRKRKLSYSAEGKLSTAKLTNLFNSSITKNSKSIVISDDELDEKDNLNTPINSMKQSQVVSNTSPIHSKSKKKLVIKLPLSSNKKRKKSKLLTVNKLEDSESSDPEKNEEMNRLKKSKTSNTISNTAEISEINISNNVCEIDGKSQKNILLDVELKHDFKETQIAKKVKLFNTSITELNTGSEELVKEEEVDDKNNQSEIQLILSPNKDFEETAKNISLEKKCMTENRSISQAIINNSSSPKIEVLSPILKTLDERKKVELERKKKKELEAQNRKEKDETRRIEKEELKRKEKQEKEDFKRKEKEEKEELKRKEKEEKEELKRKEKDEKEKKRLVELEMKNEEKRQKDDEKRKKDEQKEEERKKRDDDKRKKELEKEELDIKKRKAAEAFTKFFRQKKTESTKINFEEDESSLNTSHAVYRAFMPFQLKGDMKLAPIVRKNFNNDSKNTLDEFITNKFELSEPKLYLNVLKNAKYVPYKLDIAKDENSNDVIFIENENEFIGQSINESRKSVQYHKAKYFHFEENRRPPYYGTWRKKSTVIGPRRPFSHDKIYFEYDVDSDDEWEEEEPGESLRGSDDENESDDEYEVDNEFFVPHGHLSDEEMQNEDETDQGNSPECQKAKLKILQQEFAKEMKKKTEKITPRLIGIIWVDENGNQPQNCPNPIWETLNKRKMTLCSGYPLIFEPKNKSLEAGSPTLKYKKQSKQIELPEEFIVDLIRLVHGNSHKKSFLIHEFQSFIAEKLKSQENPVVYSKAVIRKNIDKISQWTILENEENKKSERCRLVFSKILSMYSLENISNTNSWKYILPVSTKSISSAEKSQYTKKNEDNIKTVEQNNHSKGLSDITIFTKVITKVETNCEKEREPSVSATQFVKKRVPLLMSVPRGQSIPETYKNELISNFLKKEKQKEADSTKNTSESTTKQCPVNAESVILID